MFGPTLPSQKEIKMTQPAPKIGSVIWTDLTVADAPRLAQFYQAVVGWEAKPLEHEGGDYNMNVPGTQTPAAGVCHARGSNKALPPQWLIYVRVKDVAASVAACEKLGGKVVCPVAGTGYVIQDPAGAVMAILPAAE